MPSVSVLRSILLPEQEFISLRRVRNCRDIVIQARKRKKTEYCPRCATASEVTYDTRKVKLKDEPLHTRPVWLELEKRRLWCKPCRLPFTEPIQGVRKGHRHTERYGRTVMRSCERYVDLKQVRCDFKCSGGWLYKNLYRHLALEQRKRQYPWPHAIGIDEHFFRRENSGFRSFVSVLVDLKNHRLMEVVNGRTTAELEASLLHIPGRENVRVVALDMSDTFRSFARRFFPNAALVADKFHVLRLLSPAINRYRKAITGDRRTLPLRRLLLMNGRNLSSWMQRALRNWLEDHPELRQLYEAKEALSNFYRVRSREQAEYTLTRLTDRLASASVPELLTFRKTLMRWREEILAYFTHRVTNGMTEGFNGKAKLVKRRAYGYKSFFNYRLRLLNACA